MAAYGRTDQALLDIAKQVKKRDTDGIQGVLMPTYLPNE
jgi:hypothetical protein